MTTEDWFDALTAKLLARSPFRRSEYFRRFAAGALSRADVWGHISQHYLLIAAFPRIFSGIHTRCDDFEVRKDCARHLLVEELADFDGRVGGTPDHDELFRRIGDDLGYPREAYERIAPVPEMAAIIAFFRRLAHEIPWSAALCATALLEEEVVEIAQTVGRAHVQHYGVRPEWGGMNYTVHEAIEKQESRETKRTILKHLRAPDDRRAAEAAMREMHRLPAAYAEGRARHRADHGVLRDLHRLVLLPRLRGRVPVAGVDRLLRRHARRGLRSYRGLGTHGRLRLGRDLSGHC